MKTTTFRFILGATAAFCLAGGAARGMCVGDENAAAEWIFEPVAEAPSWALNSGADGDMGNLGLTGGAAFSTNVPPPNCDCGHSLFLPPEGGVAGAVSINDYDPLAGAEKFTLLAWVRREGAPGENLSARIFSDADSVSLTNTTAGVEFRFSGAAGNLALRIDGTEVATTVGGIAPTNGEWRHVAVVFDGTRPATNYATRNVHFYVDGIQRGVGNVLQDVVPATNDAPVVVGNASPSRTSQNLLAGHIDDVLALPGWAPDAVGNGNANPAIQCFMDASDDIFPPVIAAPPDVEAEAGPCLAPVAVPLGSATASDDCGVALVTNDAPAVFEVGMTTVTWTAFDAAGNAATATQRVTVLPSRSADCDGDGWSDWEETMEWDADPFDRLDAPNGEVARGVLLHAVKYSAASADQWVQLHCSAPREVDLSGFRLQVAGTNWATKATFPAETRMRPGHFLLVGGAGVTNADLTADLALAGSYPDQPTAGIRLMPPGDASNAPVDVLMYGSHVPFNEQGLDATGWRSATTDLWASATRHLERWSLGSDTDRENDWRHTADGAASNADDVPDSDGDGLTDEEEYRSHLDPMNPDTDGDGLTDAFERDHRLDPALPDTDGDGTPDGEEIDPETGLPYEARQLADGLRVDITRAPGGWSQGDDLGLDGVVEFTLSEVTGFAVWGTVWEGGVIPESYTVAVEEAALSQTWEKRSAFGHKIVILFAVPDGTNAMRVVVTDASRGSGVTNPPDLGADIRARFQAVKLDVEAGGVDEEHEESPGVFLLDRTAHTNAPRTPCRLSVAPVLPQMTPPLQGTLILDWDEFAVHIYPEDQPDEGQPLSRVEVPLDGFFSTNLWLEALAATNSFLEWQWNGQADGRDWVSINGVRLFLSSVSFGGEKMHTIVRDDGSAAFISPQWIDGSWPPDGDADDASDIKKPICYTRDTKMNVSAYWSFRPLSPSWSIQVKGKGPDNLNFPPSTATLMESIVYIENVECDNPFPNRVAYYPALEIKWKFSMDGGRTWLDAGASGNPTYITLGDPLTIPYHSLVHLGCVNAAGKTTGIETADAVYAEFMDREVRRVSDNRQMTYWYNNQQGATETGQLLQSSDANGNCQAWSALLRDIFRVHGILSNRVQVWPSSPEEVGVMMKYWQFSNSPSGTGTYPYAIPYDVRFLYGIPGQGNPSPPNNFTAHWITEACGYFYDPSYGSPKIGGNSRNKAYEDCNIDGYTKEGKQWCRKNDISAISGSEVYYAIDDY